MANTLKFGDGKWATGEGTALAFNDENDNFKPLPFTFTRNSSATVVNQSGLIEEVGSDVPRIDFKDNTKGALLLEPSRTNLVTYSEDGSQWNTHNATVASSNDSTSPSGQSSVYKVTDDTVSSQHRVDVRPAVISGTEYTFSAFVKKPSDSDINFAYLLFTVNFSPTQRFYFNINEGTSLDSGGTIEDYGNGWFRISASFTATSSGNGLFGVNLTNANDNNTYTGTGNGSMFVYGIQVEAASYATSYIPTQGSAVTRVRDLCDTENLSYVIGQTEGVIFYDAILVRKSTGTSEDLFELSIDDGSNQNIFYINSYNNTLAVGLNSGGSNQFYNNSYNPTEGARYKLAFAYKQNDFALYINGNQIATDSSGTVPTMNQITFGNYFNNQFNLANSVKVNDFKLYNTRLTDAELATLTT